MILIYVSYDDKEKAELLVLHLLQRKLIAAANIVPAESVHWWKSNDNYDDTVAILMKTRNDLWDAVRDAIKHEHRYDVPCIMKIPVEVNPEYDAWVTEHTS